MKLEFEKWVENQKFSNSSNTLFEEAFQSFKGGAYKASLLFSYLGFLNVIKQRILASDVPEGFKEEKYEKIKNGLRDNENWDSNVFDCLKRNTGLIFVLSESIKRELFYWRDRRNDCAHFKNEKIEYYHTESFWSFLQSNLDKFNVKGSQEKLILDFQDFFDESLTSSRESIEPLIKQIYNSIPVQELPVFFQRIKDEFIGVYIDNLTFQSVYIFSEILKKGSSELKLELNNYLKSLDNEFLYELLSTFPEIVQIIDFKEKFYRWLWYEKINKSMNDYNLYTSILSKGIISSEDLVESHMRIAERSKKLDPFERNFIDLQRSGYYEYLEGKIFPEDGFFNFNEPNSYKSAIIHCLKYRQLTNRKVKSLLCTFDNRYYPIQLYDSLIFLLNNNPVLKQKIQITIDNEGYKVPDALSEVFNDPRGQKN